MDIRELLKQGRDILGETVLAQGEPSEARLCGLLPRQAADTYGFVSDRAAWGGVVIQPNGSPEKAYGFDVWQRYPCVMGVYPRRFWQDGRYPIAHCRYEAAGSTLELVYVVAEGDTADHPDLWTRAELDGRREYFILCDGVYCPSRGATAEEFDEVYAETLAGWRAFDSRFAAIRLPEARLNDTVYGCLNAVAATFTGAHPHYGHREYAMSPHDHFPPNFLTAMEANLILGNVGFAAEIAEYLLRYAVGANGALCYRQSVSRLSGVSASEYGQLLWLLGRYAPVLEARIPLRAYEEKLRGMGGVLLRGIAPCPEHPALRLIQMCAEADTNGRLYAYVQNNYWAYRGLMALDGLLRRWGAGDGGALREAARQLRRDTDAAVAAERVPTRFGPLPPFHIGYTATPLTLGDCRDTFYPVDDETYADYLHPSDLHDGFTARQDYMENVYANYRYYPELLAVRCLPREDEDAIVRLRETLGGELLGMTRFRDWLDDWPAFHYARFLLETDRIDKYLLLLYAHAEYHGSREEACYYEQVELEGRVRASDCVPSAALAPLMTAWAFASEPVGEDALYLLRGVPRAWFAAGFCAEGLITRWGPVSLTAKPGERTVTIEISLPPVDQVTPVVLCLRGLNTARFLRGGEALEPMGGERARVKPHTTELSLELER